MGCRSSVVKCRAFGNIEGSGEGIKREITLRPQNWGNSSHEKSNHGGGKKTPEKAYVV